MDNEGARGGIADILSMKLVGRGGQGVVTAGEILARAVYAEGRHAQSIPTFGPERRGGPAACSLRISTHPIRIKAQVGRFSQLICFDPTFWLQFPIFLGLTSPATVVLNSAASGEEIVSTLMHGALPVRPPLPLTVFAVDATSIALEVFGRAITSTAMLAAYGAATGTVSLPALIQTAERYLDDPDGQNAAVMRRTAESLRGPFNALAVA